MNSFIVVASMGMCLAWMISLVDYQSYQRLTTNLLVQTTQDEYVREGLLVYAQAYYAKYRKSLVLPGMIIVREPLARAGETLLVSLEQTGECLILRASLKGISLEKRVLLKGLDIQR